MIRQRFLYVGIGGSGLDIGRELTDALTREVCGLDGRRLVEKGGAFAGYKRNQLPKFIQSVYLDFSASALTEISTHLQGKNATAIHTILPPFNSSREAATFLRNQNVPQVQDWLPDDSSVNIAPLSAGAGQYPNVGRTALFASLKRQGYGQSLGNDLGRALDNLAQSMGELTSFTGTGVHTNSIAVYLGFSLSGGTGCGTFYDVIHLLYNELITRFEDIPCTIMPIVIMPSLFESVLVGVNRRNTQLNAATALLDLSRLMDLFNNPDPELAESRRVMYPWSAVDGAGSYRAINLDTQFGKTAVKVATLVEKRGGLDRKDVYRSIASAVVSQVSTIATVNQMTMGFVDKLVNDNEIRDMHHTLLGRKNIMPAVSASLTVPSERLVDVISQRIAADGLAWHRDTVTNLNVSKDLSNTFLEGSGQGQIVRPELFPGKVDITFATSQGALADSKKLEQFQTNIQKKVQQSLTNIVGPIKESIPEMQEIRVLDGLIEVLNKQENCNLYDAIVICRRGIRALQGARFTEDAPTARTTRAKSSKGVLGLFKGKPQKADVDRWVKAQESDYVRSVEDIWWNEWNSKRITWQSSAESAERELSKIETNLRELSDSADRVESEEIVRLQRTTLGVVEYLPSTSGNMTQALAALMNAVKDKIRERYAVNQPDAGSLLSAIMRANQQNIWGDLIRTFKQEREGTAFIDQLVDAVRSAVQDVMQDALTPLSEQLGRLANSQSGNLSSDLAQLQSKLAGLLPDGIIPPINGAKPRVLITYPGREDSAVETYLQSTIFGTRFASFNQNEVFQFAAAGDYSSITATINIVGQGLLDSEEVRQLMATWIEANKNPIATDKLAWRQRVNLHNLRDITDVPNRRVILRNFLAALYDGHVSITKGSVELPEEVRITKPGTTAFFDIPLVPQFGASPWSSLFNGFEERIVTSSSLTNPGLPTAIKWFGEYLPTCLNLGQTAAQPSDLFEQVMLQVLKYQDLKESDEVTIGLTQEALTKRQAIYKFWRSDIIESLTTPYLNAGNTAFYCIGAPYAMVGASQRMRDQLSEIIRTTDEKIRKLIREEQERRVMDSTHLG